MTLVFTLGILFLSAIGAYAYIIYIKHQKKKSLERIKKLELERDTVRIVEEHKRAQAAKAWEEFDRNNYDSKEWEKRFEQYHK